jgi:putative hydrolase of the HAD superfamily
MIKSILFDLDGTLRHSNPTGDQVSLKYLREQGWKISEEAAQRAERWEHYYFASSPEIQSDMKTYREQGTFWVNFTRRRLVALGFNPKHAKEFATDVSKYMSENYKPESIVPDEVFTLLTSLKKDGYVLGVVSNRETPFDDELKELKLDSYFHFTLAGGEVNSYKPEKAIFEHAIGRARTSPAETVYVGDNYFADILGSHRAGLMPVLYDPRGLFPEAECAVIKSFDEVPTLLK